MATPKNVESKERKLGHLHPDTWLGSRGRDRHRFFTIVIYIYTVYIYIFLYIIYDYCNQYRYIYIYTYRYIGTFLFNIFIVMYSNLFLLLLSALLHFYSSADLWWAICRLVQKRDCNTKGVCRICQWFFIADLVPFSHIHANVQYCTKHAF